MQKVKLWAFYTIGWYLHPITEVKAGTKLRDINEILYLAWSALIDMAMNFRSICKSEREELENYLFELYKKADFDSEETLQSADIEKVKRFENILESQLNDLKIYLVSQREWYSTATLVEKGEELIPADVRHLITDYAKNEMRQAGKCIAFNLPSAAGFHIIRALEDSIRKYYDVITEGKPRPKNESMGVLIAELEKEPNANKIILSALKQIKDLHRNPYIHDVVLTINEVIILLGIVQSAILAIGQELNKSK